jgi:hypothetical protein
MATWHQSRRRVRLYHDTAWTVVIDPPNELRCLMLFNTEHEATRHAESFNAKHSGDTAYVLVPVGSYYGKVIRRDMLRDEVYPYTGSQRAR